ncbi:hypothetical protein L208DRAFT_1423658 [Tricholoma matsutake]|nr:hypothetical protein L208DRAFT_1423658 [Tricholoma matsutake 945]
MKSLIKKVYDKLACISWASDINGFPATITMNHLATYLTKNWLSDEYENKMLHLLRWEVLSKRGEDGISISDTSFKKNLLMYIRWSTGQNIMQQCATTPGSKKRDKNWQLASLTCLILYGNSMGGTIDEDIKNALTWWIHHHTGRHFNSSFLPIMYQRDGHSCGILAWIALATFLFPKTYSLVDAGAIADERLRMFLQVAEHHSEKSFNATAE